MLIVVKTKEKMIDAGKIAEAIKRLNPIIDIDSFDVYNENEYGIVKKIPVYTPESLAKAYAKDKEHFTAAEVRGMSVDEVGANYDKILESSKKWGGKENA